MPSIDLVDFDTAKVHLAVDHDFDDALIQIYLTAASAIILECIHQDAPRTERQALPIPDPVTGAYPPTLVNWPYTTLYTTPSWPAAGTNPQPLWWPAPMISYQNLAPYIANEWMDTSDNIIPANVPKAISTATLLVLGTLYKDREGQTDPITPAVKTLLAKYYDIGCA